MDRPVPNPKLTATLEQGLTHCIESTDFDLGALNKSTKQSGKVRDSYLLNDRERLLVTTDRISAFDRVLGTLPYKGQVLNQLSAWWFEHTKGIVPNHLIQVIDPNITLAHNCTPLPAEFVVRAYLTGVTDTSIWKHYERGARSFCGHTLPDGMRKNQPLAKPILTPSTKAGSTQEDGGGHDKSVSREEVLAQGLITPEDFDQAADYALKLFHAGQQWCVRQGLILVDTKYEFGKTPDGRIVVIDEIHTPDSSRYWFSNSYESQLAQGAEPESFDKEHVRKWLAGQGFTGDGPIPTIPDHVRTEASTRYIKACETIQGTPFIPNTDEPQARMQQALASLTVD